MCDDCVRRETWGVAKQGSRGENARSEGWVHEACAVNMPGLGGFWDKRPMSMFEDCATTTKGFS